MPLRYPDIPGYEDYQPASPPPTPPQYPPEVEQWRPLVSKYFGAQDVDKALYVIQHESGGDPSAPNRDAAVNGLSPGLFQITMKNARAAGIDPTNPEQATKWAADQVAAHGWTDFGEGTNYRGVNFGALGAPNPFGPGGTGINDIGRITGGFVGAAVKSAMNAARSPDFPSSPYEPDAPVAAPEDTALGSEGTLRAKLLADRGDSSAYGGIPRAALGAALNTGINAVTKVAEGYDAINPNVPYVTPVIDYGKRQVKEGVANTLTDIETAPKRIGGFLSRASLPNSSATNPLAGIESNIQQATAPLSPDEQHLQNLNAAVAEQGLGLVPSKALDLGLAALPEVPAALREGRAVLAEAGPRIAASDLSRFLPDSILTEERAGAGIARQAGVDPLLGARARLRLAGGSMTPEEEAAAAEAASRAPRPGQGGLFGGVVDESGQLAPMEVPAQMTPPSMPLGGEGTQSPMFGGPDKSAGVQPGFGAVKPQEAPRPEPPTPPEAIHSEPTPLPPVNGINRETRTVKASDLEFRPDLFQARDASPGKPYGEGRVKQIVENWDDAKFIPPDAVPDPENPDKLIVYSGHHRTEAFIRRYGEDAPIRVNVTHADINDPQQLNRMRGLARAANFDTAVPNFREAVRAAEIAQHDGLSPEAIAAELRITPSKVDELLDAARVGPQAIDRVVSEPSLEPYVKEIGRAMRVYGVNTEDANGMFARIATGTKAARPTPAALRETLDKFGAVLSNAEVQRMQGTMFAGGEAFGGPDRGGLLALIDENSRIRTELKRASNAVSKAQSGANKLANLPNALPENKDAAARLVKLGADEKLRLDAMIGRNEENLARAAQGEPPLPEPEAPAAGNASIPPPPTRGVPPEQPPPPPKPPVSGDSLDQLIAHVQEAGAARPDLLAARKEELGRRVARAEQRLQVEGAAPEEAMRLARRELRGQLADPAFHVPGELDTRTLHQAILDSADAGVPFFTRSTATDGLDKLGAGIIPAPHEVRALGQIFGPRLQYAVEELGDVFKVQKRVEERLLREPLQVTFPDNTPITPDKLSEILRNSIPDASESVRQKVAERLIDEDKIKVAVGRDGKARLTVGGGRGGDALGDAVRKFNADIPHNEVPHQEVPPVSPRLGDEHFQPSVSLAKTDFTDVTPPEAHPYSLHQQQLERAKSDLGAADPSAATPQAPPPGGSTSAQANRQYDLPGKDWKPGESLLSRIWKDINAIPSLPKAFLSTLDRSAVLRQGGGLIRHGEQVKDAIAKTMIIAADEEHAARLEKFWGFKPPTADEVMQPVLHGKWAQARKDAGLVIEDWGPNAKNPNEQFTSQLAHKVFGKLGSEMSERSYAVYLNKLRADVFDSVVEKWMRDGRSFLPDAERQIKSKDLTDLANYLNATTGHGTLGQFEGAAKALSQLWFSPRNLVSRFQTIEMLFDPRTSNLVRKEMAKDLAVYVGGGIALLTLADMSGLAKVELDPRSTDFGKMRIGNTRIDFWGGYQQIARYGAQLITGQVKSSTGTVYDADRAQIGLRYLRSKLSPSAGAGVDLLADDQMSGQKIDFSTVPGGLDFLYHTATPLFIQDTVDSIRENGSYGLATMPLSFFGLGTATYQSPFEARKDTRDEVSREKYGVDYNKLVDAFPDKGFTYQADVNADPRVTPLNDKVKEASKNLPFGQDQEHRQQYADELNTRRESAEQKFEAGDLPKSLPEIWSDISKEAAGARRQHEIDTNSGERKGSEFDKALNGYFDQNVMDAGIVDWDATTAKQQEYLDGLPEARRQQIENFLGEQEKLKSPLYREYKQYIRDRDAQGYFKDGITQAERTALDKADPRLDVQGWKFKGGVRDKNDPTLQTPQAVEMALKLADTLPGREVRYGKLDRPINQDANSRKAWNEAKDLLVWYDTTLIDANAKAEGARLAKETGDKEYARPLDQMETQHRGVITGNLHEAAKKSSKELDAYLYWWGAEKKPITQQGANYAQTIVNKYGSKDPHLKKP